MVIGSIGVIMVRKMRYLGLGLVRIKFSSHGHEGLFAIVVIGFYG